MGDIVVFEPEKFVYTRERASRSFWLRFVAGVVIGTFLLVYWSSKGDVPIIFDVVIGIFMCYPLLHVWRTRFPTRITVDRGRRVVEVEYLNGFGAERTDTIALDGALIRFYAGRSKYNQNSREVRITQSMINNFIYIDGSHGFTDEQLQAIYDTASVSSADRRS